MDFFLFRGCTSLKKINLSSVNIEKVVSDKVLEKCRALETIMAKVSINKLNSGDMSDIAEKIKTQIGKTPVANFVGRKRLFDGNTRVVEKLTEQKTGKVKEVLESKLGSIVEIEVTGGVRLRGGGMMFLY